MNAMKTTLLLGLLSGLLIIGGGAIAGDRGMAYGLVMAVAMNFFSYFFSEKMALMSARAQRVSETQYPEIYTRLQPIVETLAQRMGIPMPKLWVTPDLSPNAFATGRNPTHASVAVTDLTGDFCTSREERLEDRKEPVKCQRRRLRPSRL